jgi:DNA-binding CsgD family transcriptional regulator
MNMHVSESPRQCPLNETELECVRWLCQGKTPGEIAYILGEHRMTTGRRIHRIYEKTGTFNWHGLVGHAYHEGWLMTKQLPAPQWRHTTHQQKVDLIKEAYNQGFVTIGDLASHLSSALGSKLHTHNIASVYRINLRNGGELKNYPLQTAPKPFVADVDEAEKLWRAGLSGEDITKELGITRNQVYWLIDRNRERFPRRIVRIGSPAETAVKSNTQTKHPDRVTRVTPTGVCITLPRVSFIDGAPA